MIFKWLEFFLFRLLIEKDLKNVSKVSFFVIFVTMGRVNKFYCLYAFDFWIVLKGRFLIVYCDCRKRKNFFYLFNLDLKKYDLREKRIYVTL